MPKSIEQRLREAFTVAGYIFFQNCEQAQRQKILLYSSIPDELVRPMGMRSFSDMGALLKEADLAGKSIYVIPNGATVLQPGDRTILFIQTQFSKKVMQYFKGRE